MPVVLVALALVRGLVLAHSTAAAGGASLLAAAQVEGEAQLCIEASCPVRTDGSQGETLSLLQHNGQKRYRHGHEDVLPTVEYFPGAQLIYAELPVSPLLEASAGYGGLLGDALPPLLGGPDLDLSSTARLIVAHFHEAKISWEGIPGRSPQLSLPHHFLSIQLPITQHGEKLYSTVYSLVDDDAVMLIKRLGSGVPAKIAEFDLPKGVATNASLTVRRRGLSVLQCEVVDEGEISPDAEELSRVFDRKDVNRLGTHLEVISSLRITHVTKAKIRAARRASLRKVRWTGSKYEPVGMFFLPTWKARAWVLEADLEATGAISGTPIKVPTPNMHAMMLRTGGNILHPEVRASPLHWEQYQNGLLVWVEQRVDTEAVSKALPPNFVLQDPLALVYTVHWNPTTIYGVGIKTFSDPFVYSELWVVLRVKYKGRPFNYPVLMLLDDDVAMMGGQDLIGCPKKLANFSYSASSTPGSPMHLNISRRGRQVLSMSGRIGKTKRTTVVRGLNDKVHNAFAWVFSHEFPWAPQYQSPSYLFMRSAMTPRTQNTINVSDLQVSWGSSAQEPLGEWFAKEPPASAGFMHVDQAWLPYIDTMPHMDPATMKLEYSPLVWVKKPMKMLFLEQMPGAEYQNWWEQNYQNNYM